MSSKPNNYGSTRTLTFIGHDEYYRQEVDRVQTLGRFISGSDLQVFVEDFISHYDRKSELIAEEPGRYRLNASDKLVRFIVEQPEDDQKSEFCRRLPYFALL